ncbi:hypothetical protein [Salegentibacter mishustinae]|uniref:hypothetical protein n=1 Tax=Salegentibacter mishustinae TaxID=270918 RepID=UPI0009FA17D2|nr:hypothetical protein [Salegentibacter mishustinae]PZX60623.1 hypothetical protein LY54_03307 [Salegentibacter mishustinae]GGX00760.1 hypothetical protein GCM10008086_32290 [Salegentibacter mishustinae]
MQKFYVNTNAQSNGDHEVHEDTYCSNAPSPENRRDLGYHQDCHGAVREAKKIYNKSNGCYYCCRACHTS